MYCEAYICTVQCTWCSVECTLRNLHFPHQLEKKCTLHYLQVARQKNFQLTLLLWLRTLVGKHVHGQLFPRGGFCQSALCSRRYRRFQRTFRGLFRRTCRRFSVCGWLFRTFKFWFWSRFRLRGRSGRFPFPLQRHITTQITHNSIISL